jgi:SAM-dependent methyltransferase
MASAFDEYNTSYNKVVQDSIAFSGLEHAFFLQAKIKVLKSLFERHFGADKPALADVGCGVGAMHPMLAPITSRISGCDPSGDCIERAVRDNPDVAYARSEGAVLPWADASHDAALAVCVFHHVPLVERAGLMAEMRRVVRPGGLVAIIEHNPFNPLTRLAVARCPFDHDAVLLTNRNTQGLLAAAGMTGIGSRNFLFLPFDNKASDAAENILRAVPLGAQYIAWGQV